MFFSNKKSLRVFFFSLKKKTKISGDSKSFSKNHIFHQIKSESHYSSGDACEKCGSTNILIHLHLSLSFNLTYQI